MKKTIIILLKNEQQQRNSTLGHCTCTFTYRLQYANSVRDRPTGRPTAYEHINIIETPTTTTTHQHLHLLSSNIRAHANTHRRGSHTPIQTPTTLPHTHVVTNEIIISSFSLRQQTQNIQNEKKEKKLQKRHTLNILKIKQQYNNIKKARDKII